ncbi:MAG TPA: hypothetical protein VMV10_12150, partial [Pirellulales bacterium]|nr:hypothetical protein [Pirellulales bacterium]
MGKKKKADDAERIISFLQSGVRQDLIILIIPSHDRRNKQLNNQDAWATAALELFAELYRGATAFKALKGIFKTDSGDVLVDEPILIECYAARNDVEDRTRLDELLKFAKRNRSRILTDALVNGRAEPEDRRSERLMVGQNAIAQEVSGARLGAAAP